MFVLGVQRFGTHTASQTAPNQDPRSMLLGLRVVTVVSQVQMRSYYNWSAMDSSREAQVLNVKSIISGQP